VAGAGGSGTVPEVELSPEDARRLELANGEAVDVAQLDGSGAAQSPEAGGRTDGKPEGTRLRATVAVRSGVPAGTAFLAEGIGEDSANAFTAPTVTVVKARGAVPVDPGMEPEP
jgi:anaerobic selenocysteine-containing dehydrogenase